MRVLAMCLMVAVVGCADHTKPAAEPDAPPVASPDASNLARCGPVETPKIKFTQVQGCGNDGGVEFCAPDNDPAVMAMLTSIAPALRCAYGGGRAGCLAPGLLLCSYRTAVPTECVTQHGEMTASAWADMCEIAGLPQVTEIVPTILE